MCALGKCGGRELGFASDIELMFLYEGEGKTTGKKGGKGERRRGKGRKEKRKEEQKRKKKEKKKKRKKKEKKKGKGKRKEKKRERKERKKEEKGKRRGRKGDAKMKPRRAVSPATLSSPLAASTSRTITVSCASSRPERCICPLPPKVSPSCRLALSPRVLVFMPKVRPPLFSVLVLAFALALEVSITSTVSMSPTR